MLNPNFWLVQLPLFLWGQLPNVDLSVFRFARTMGAKLGSNGAATAGRTSRCFIAATGIAIVPRALG